MLPTLGVSGQGRSMADRRTTIEKALDEHIGRAIRGRRHALEQSQVALADAVNRSFQQMQKYETGANRVSASLLYTIADAQGVDLMFYFVGFEPPVAVDDRPPGPVDRL